MDQKKIALMAKEFAKDIKSEDDLAAFSRQLVKLTVETALNAELEALSFPKSADTINNKFLI